MTGPTCPYPTPDPHACRCGKPLDRATWTCEDCLTETARLLGDMTWIAEQLEVSISRQRGVGNGAGAPSTGPSPLPWNEWASKCERKLRRTLVHWTTVMHASHVVARGGVADVLPLGEPSSWSITDMARWMTWRVDGLAHHPFGRALLQQLRADAEAATKCVTWKRLGRVYLGRCDGMLPDPEHTDQTVQPCEGEVYADEDEDHGECELCARVYALDTRRRAMEAELDARLFPAAEIARLSTFLGLDLDRDQVRKRVNLWHHRRRIACHNCPEHGSARAGSTPLFRYGEVRPLLYRDNARVPPKRSAR